MVIDAIWLWAILGIILLAVEVGTGTFDILWFGIAAIIMAFLLHLFPGLMQKTALQLIIYGALSLISLAAWRFYYKKNETHARVGQSQGLEIGRVGILIADCGPNQRGKIRFTQGLMGAREWPAVADNDIKTGSEAEVIAVEGNSLRIKAV